MGNSLQKQRKIDKKKKAKEDEFDFHAPSEAIKKEDIHGDIDLVEHLDSFSTPRKSVTPPVLTQDLVHQSSLPLSFSSGIIQGECSQLAKEEASLSETAPEPTQQKDEDSSKAAAPSSIADDLFTFRVEPLNTIDDSPVGREADIFEDAMSSLQHIPETGTASREFLADETTETKAFSTEEHATVVITEKILVDMETAGDFVPEVKHEDSTSETIVDESDDNTASTLVVDSENTTASIPDSIPDVITEGITLQESEPKLEQGHVMPDEPTVEHPLDGVTMKDATEDIPDFPTVTREATTEPVQDPVMVHENISQESAQDSVVVHDDIADLSTSSDTQDSGVPSASTVATEDTENISTLADTQESGVPSASEDTENISTSADTRDAGTSTESSEDIHTVKEPPPPEYKAAEQSIKQDKFEVMKQDDAEPSSSEPAQDVNEDREVLLDDVPAIHEVDTAPQGEQVAPVATSTEGIEQVIDVVEPEDNTIQQEDAEASSLEGDNEEREVVVDKEDVPAVHEVETTGTEDEDAQETAEAETENITKVESSEVIPEDIPVEAQDVTIGTPENVTDEVAAEGTPDVIADMEDVGQPAEAVVDHAVEANEDEEVSRSLEIQDTSQPPEEVVTETSQPPEVATETSQNPEEVATSEPVGMENGEPMVAEELQNAEETASKVDEAEARNKLQVDEESTDIQVASEAADIQEEVPASEETVPEVEDVATSEPVTAEEETLHTEGTENGEPLAQELQNAEGTVSKVEVAEVGDEAGSSEAGNILQADEESTDLQGELPVSEAADEVPASQETVREVEQTEAEAKNPDEKEVSEDTEIPDAEVFHTDTEVYNEDVTDKVEKEHKVDEEATSGESVTNVPEEAAISEKAAEEHTHVPDDVEEPVLEEVSTNVEEPVPSKITEAQGEPENVSIPSEEAAANVSGDVNDENSGKQVQEEVIDKDSQVLEVDDHAIKELDHPEAGTREEQPVLVADDLEAEEQPVVDDHERQPVLEAEKQHLQEGRHVQEEAEEHVAEEEHVQEEAKEQLVLEEPVQEHVLDGAEEKYVQEEAEKHVAEEHVQEEAEEQPVQEQLVMEGPVVLGAGKQPVVEAKDTTDEALETSHESIPEVSDSIKSTADDTK